MIPRYSRPEMVAIWEPATKFRIWFEIEAHACDAMADLGVIPRENAKAVWKAKDVDFDVARIDEIEAETKHDVIAFLTHLAEHVGSDEARFVHQGMTSSDVLDTCFNIQLTRAADILIADMEGLLAALKRRAYEHKDTIRIGRSHGIHAEPTTMGLTFARFYAEMDRNLTRLRTARKRSRQGPSPARSAHSPMSTRVSRSMSARSLASRPNRSARRSSRATATRRSSPRLASWPAALKTSPPKSATCSAPKCWRRLNSSQWGKRARLPCRTRKTRC